MKAFIKKHNYNYIRKCLTDLNNAFIGCVDIDIIETSKAYIQDKILNQFVDLSSEEKSVLDISNITKPYHTDKYLEDLNEYVYGMPAITNAQISRLFKKEGRFKLPSHDAQASKNVYLGWVDEASRKLFIAYEMDGKLLGMACRIGNQVSRDAHRCILCNHEGGGEEVAFVSPLCKTANTSEGAYKSLGFDICLNSEKCNSHIVTAEKLERLLKDVNNIKD